MYLMMTMEVMEELDLLASDRNSVLVEVELDLTYAGSSMSVDIVALERNSMDLVDMYVEEIEQMVYSKLVEKLE